MQGDIEYTGIKLIIYNVNLAMQGDIDSYIYQSSLFILSAMQVDIEHIDMKLFFYKLNFSNAR